MRDLYILEQEHRAKYVHSDCYINRHFFIASQFWPNILQWQAEQKQADDILKIATHLALIGLANLCLFQT